MQGVAGRNFQLLPQPKYFPSNVAGTGQMDQTLYQIISTMPAWSPTGEFGRSSKNFFDTYRQVLGNIIWKVSPERELVMINLQNKVTAANNAYNRAVTNTNQAYINAKNSGGAIFAARYPTIMDWINSNAGKSFAKAEDDAATTKNQTQDLYNQQAASEVPNDVADALRASKFPENLNPNNDPSPRGWTKVDDGSGLLEFAPAYKVGMTAQELRAFNTEGSVGGFSVSIDASESQSTITNSWASASARVNVFFWEVYVNSRWEKLDIDTEDQSIKATFSASASTSVDVTPGPWFNSGLMANIASGGGGLLTMANSAQPTFGKDGLLSTQVSGLVAAFNPSMTLEMSAETFKRNQQLIEASAGFRYGPFSVGGSGGHSSDFKKSTSKGTTFQMESTSSMPLMIGVTIAFPGSETPVAHSPVRQMPIIEAPVLNGKKGIHIYHEGKIHFTTEGRYHFHIQEA